MLHIFLFTFLIISHRTVTLENEGEWTVLKLNVENISKSLNKTLIYFNLFRPWSYFESEKCKIDTKPRALVTLLNVQGM